jgi:hypothetical protein
MISDVLSQAAEDIRRYQREMPEVYDRHKAALATVLDALERAHMRLGCMDYATPFKKQLEGHKHK